MYITELFEAQDPSSILVVYPGRFQPWHKGHKMVYDYLVKIYGRDNVFVTTSNKVDPPRSPFTFSEKQQFMHLTGVSADRIVETRDPYRALEVVQKYNPKTARLVFAVSEKDMAEDPRFKFGYKKDGSPTYFQPMPKNVNDMQPFETHGYIMTVPTFNFTVLGKPMKSATEVRAQFAQADEATQQAIVKDLFGAYDRHVHDIMKHKLSQTITESIAVGTKLDLTKNYGNFETLIGVVKDITPSGKLKIQIAQAEPVPGKKGAVRVGDVVTMASNYVKGTVLENFADGKNPQDKGDAKRHGVPTKASVSTLRKVAKQGGRKGQLAHWMANMKSGRAKAKNESVTGSNQQNKKFVLYLNGEPVAKFDTEQEARQQSRYITDPNTRIELKHEICTLTPIQLKENLKTWAKLDQGVAEAATDDPRFQKMMGNIQKSTPNPVNGYVAVSYASERPSKKIKGVTYNGKPMPSTVDPEEFMGSKIKFTPDQIEEKLMKIGQKYGWDSIDSGHGQGYDELYFDTSAEYTSATQRQLAVNIVKTVNEIDKFFNEINRSLQATGLPGYKVNVWQGMGENGNINQHEDLSHITNIAKGQTAKPDAGPAIGKMILKHLPSYEAENDELGYDPQAFTMAKAIANTYITQGERAGLEAQGSKIAGNLSVSHMIDELLSDAGASGLRTIWTLDEKGVAEGYDNTTFGIARRKLNVPALIKAGALFVTYPHGEQGWETDNQEDWAYSLLSLYNVMQGGWPGEAKKYLKPASYKKAEQQVNSSAPNLGSDKLVYDGKYNQILWSIKKLGIPDNVAFLDDGQESVAEGLTEARNSLFAFVKQHFPSWPDYVLKDFLYAQAKGIRDQAELDDFLKRNKQDFGNCKWTLTKLPITFDIFTPKTQRMLASREGGSSNTFQVPRDAERHAQQSQMIQQKGVSAEPIIVAKLSNGYDLIEGWHRTIQHLKAFPQGYTGPAWVCTGATYKSESVEQGILEGSGEDPLDLSSDYALYIANAGRHMMTQLTNLAKKIQTDSTAAQNAKRWNLGDYMHQHYETDDMNAINRVFEEYGVGGFFDQNLYELLAGWSSQGSEYVTTWKQYSGDVIKNSTRKPGAQSVHEQGVAEGEVIPFARKQLTWQQLPKDVLKLANDWFWADDDDSSLAAVLDPKGYGSGTRNDVQYIAAQLQQRGWTIDHDLEDNRPGEFNLKLTNKRGQSVLLPWDDARNFTGWAQGTNSNLHEGSEKSIDPNFVGFMNKTMADRVDKPKVDTLANAPTWYKNAPVMNFNAMPSHKKALQFGLAALSKLDPATSQQLAIKGESAIVSYLLKAAKQTKVRLGFVEEDLWECQDYLSDVFHDPNINSWVDVLKQNITEDVAEVGVAEGDENQYRRPSSIEAAKISQQTNAKLDPARSKFVWKRPNQIGGSFSEQDLVSKGFKKSQYNSWGGTQAMWNRLTTVGEQLDRPTPTAQQILDKHNLSVEDFIAQLRLGVKVELEHTKDAKTAYEIALDHLNERPDYYTVLARTGLEEAASGYIPTAAEKDDPRFKTALTVDVRPGTDKKNMRALRLIK
jgi:hypothetical protein